MSTSLLVVTCGRQQYVAAAIESSSDLACDFDRRVIVDDSMNPNFALWLHGNFGRDFEIISHKTKGGLSGAVRTGWEALSDSDWIFHLEEDFVFPGPVDVDSMIDRCEWEELAQVCLVRQPCNATESAAGGLLEGYPAEVREHDGWCSQSHLFSLNPCVIPKWVRDVGWPKGGGEREFTDRLLQLYPDTRFGYEGSFGDPPACLHIGASRSPTWKL